MHPILYLRVFIRAAPMRFGALNPPALISLPNCLGRQAH